ncbi:hypothetical protein ACQPZX_42795 [Actinoplanes sp. CA-142083]
MLAWTIADLDGQTQPGQAQIGEAIQLRMGETHEYAG